MDIEKSLFDNLHEFFGFDNFKGDQEAIVTNVLNKKDTFVIMPTGGGKTLLCAHSIPLAAKALGREWPLTLWMMPSNIIKQQTLATLTNPHHPNYLALQQAFGDNVRVFDIADFVHICPQDIAGKACIVVSTFASLRVEDTAGRRAYDHHEALEGHFSRVDPNAPDLERKDDDGQIKFSFVNLLHVYQPLILVDEAHNAKSELSTQVWQRINPLAVIEYTATPTGNSNLLESISAQELKGEEMIKLPIVLQTHSTWQQAIAASLQTRARLETLAAQEAQYIRPLLLIQAQDKNGEVTVQVLKQHLCEQENIPSEQIVIATGEQRELDGVNLFDRACPVRVVITVQALKEGWDCPFAYVLCSVASTRSTIAVEQLLGRVLRMPYASQRAKPELNHAYAHVSGASWPHAVSTLTDRLISMGFESSEADYAVALQPGLLGGQPTGHRVQDSGVADSSYAGSADFSVPLTQAPQLSALPPEVQAQVTVQPDAERFVLQVHRPDAALLAQIAKTVPDKKDRRELLTRATKWLRAQPHNAKPADRGEPFVVPQLCLTRDGITLTLEAEHCLGMTGWNPLDYYRAIGKDEFAADEQAQVWVVDVENEKLSIQQRRAEQQLLLSGVPTELDVTDLAVNLERALFEKLQGQYLAEGSLRKYLLNALQDLLQRDDMDLPRLVRARPILEQLFAVRLLAARKKAYKAAFERQLFVDDGSVCVSLDQYTFSFPAQYPVCELYDGRMVFDKHYYRDIGKMNSEEVTCALVLDQHARVKYWVRNVERQPRYAFYLPTSSDYFYPDFVARLDDGRIFVVEYKGRLLEDSDDTREKTAVGKAWAKASGNLFLMAFKQDGHGRDLAAQVRQVLG